MALPPIFTDETQAFLLKYLNNASPTGFESSGQKIWLEYIKPYIDEYHVDPYGTAYGVIHPGKEYKVVIEAHADEISWFVNYITDDGFIYVVKNGGSDHVIAPSKKVNLHTSKGVVKGVFGWPAIHTRKSDKETHPTLKNIFIDVGCTTKKEVQKLGIEVGTVITFDDQVEVLNDQYYVGRALDNRVGGFMIAQVARLLREEGIELPYSLYVVNAVQEEVGLRGAQMVAERIQPNAALITDVTHDTTTPMINKVEHGEIKAGKGPTLTTAPAVHHTLRKLVIEAAKAEEIPYQLEASSRFTGTDTDAFAYSNMGVPSVLISLPLRYMHTTVEMARINDIEHLVQLMFFALQKIEHGHDFRYFT